MINNKQVNKMIESLLGVEETYDFRRELRVIQYGMTLEDAHEALGAIAEEDKHLYTITSSAAEPYSESMDLALYAAKRIAERNEQTFVLSLEDGAFKAAYGDYGNCAEHSGANPAYTTCIAILKFHGRL